MWTTAHSAESLEQKAKATMEILAALFKVAQDNTALNMTCSFCDKPAYVTKMEPNTWKAYSYCVDCIKKDRPS